MLQLQKSALVEKVMIFTFFSKLVESILSQAKLVKFNLYELGFELPLAAGQPR